MIKHGIVALALLASAGAAQAADSTPTDIVNRHVSSGGNLDAIMADYADDAIVLQQGRAVQGKPAIRELFARMFPARPAPAPAAGTAPAAPPAGAPARPAGGGMKVTKVWEEGDVGFVTWESGPVHATEEFIVKGGKIAVQTIFMTNTAAPAAAGAPGAPPRAGG